MLVPPLHRMRQQLTRSSSFTARSPSSSTARKPRSPRYRLAARYTSPPGPWCLDNLLTLILQNIQDRIKALELLDSKVRISNVDSQASFDNIVIQVIGETSAKGDEPKKFVQTFVLAQQPSGYFVLNDILRYVEEENDEEPTEPSADAGPVSMVAPVAAEPEAQAELEAPKSKEAIQDKAELDATAIDKKLEDVGATTKHSPAASGIDTPATPAELAVDAPAKTEAPVEASAAVEKTARDVTAEEAKKPEAPKEPAPTPVASRAPPPAPAEPEPPKGPPKPLTWASLAAAAAGPKPALPVHPKTATPPAVPSKAPAAAASSVPTAPSAPAAETTTPKEPGSEWQTAGADSKRQNRPQSISGPPQEKEGTLGYVKYVTEKVTDKDLKTHLSTFGEVVYFDINRTKVSGRSSPAADAANKNIRTALSSSSLPRRHIRPPWRPTRTT